MVLAMLVVPADSPASGCSAKPEVSKGLLCPTLGEKSEKSGLDKEHVQKTYRRHAGT